MFPRSHGFSHGARLLTATAAITASALFSIGSSQAASPQIPARDYPAGASISFRPTLSNHQMDCLWGFFCEGGVPLFHLLSEDQLHRVGGWAQFAGLRQRGRIAVAFQLFASQYQAGTDADGTPFSQEAFDDLIRVVHAHGYSVMANQPHLVPAAANGGSIAEVQRWSSNELIVMACWSGTQDVEAIVAVDHGSESVRRNALRDLTLQVLRAAGTRW
jgi:hypothetical protein